MFQLPRNEKIKGERKQGKRVQHSSDGTRRSFSAKFDFFFTQEEHRKEKNNKREKDSRRTERK
jgi:hypothetical protein